MSRLDFCFTAVLLLASGCSDPSCRPNEIKVGMFCQPVRAEQDASAEGTLDAGTADDLVMDAFVADASPSDSSAALDATACVPGSPGCVQCRPETEEVDCRAVRTCDPSAEVCPGTACDPKSFTCARQLRGTVKQCLPCVSDSECVTDHRCIPMVFGSGTTRQQLGGFCLKRLASGCYQPYPSMPDPRESLSGYPAEKYCGVDERLSSCAAVRLYAAEGRECDGTDESCGALGARCERVGGLQNFCTYSCETSLFCPQAGGCYGDLGSEYCNIPPS